MLRVETKAIVSWPDVGLRPIEFIWLFAGGRLPEFFGPELVVVGAAAHAALWSESKAIVALALVVRDFAKGRDRGVSLLCQQGAVLTVHLAHETALLLGLLEYLIFTFSLSVRVFITPQTPKVLFFDVMVELTAYCVHEWRKLDRAWRVLNSSIYGLISRGIFHVVVPGLGNRLFLTVWETLRWLLSFTLSDQFTYNCHIATRFVGLMLMLGFIRRLDLFELDDVFITVWCFAECLLFTQFVLVGRSAVAMLLRESVVYTLWIRD